jgi:hypothetical protein
MRAIVSNWPPHFSLAEFTRSQTAARKGIDNSPPDIQTEANIIRTAWFLETLRSKLRVKYGKVMYIIISSGYRCPELNAAIGGSKTSAHMRGLAADISCPGLTPLELARFIADNMIEEDFDQVIHEFGRWVHLGLSDSLPRQQLLTAMKSNGRTVYKPGLLEIPPHA